MKPFYLKFILVLAVAGASLNLLGQTGPGGVGNNSNNKLWLKADDISLGDNEPIETWSDYSGNSNHATQSTYDYRPTIINNELNGFPVVVFDGSDDFFDDDIVDYTARTILIVYKVNSSTQQSQLAQVWGYYSDGNHLALDARNNPGTWSFDGSGGGQGRVAINSGTYGSSGSNPSSPNWSEDQYEIATAEFSSTQTSTRQVIGSLYDAFTVGEHQFGGNIAEIIVFGNQLNDAQRYIVENYLAAKYSIDISASGHDYFAYESTHYYDLAGIGDVSGNENSTARSANILEIKNASSLDGGDFLLFAHDNYPTSWVKDELPTSDTNTRRVRREWRVGETNDVGGVTVSVYSTDLPTRPAGYDNFVLWVDNDGDFKNGATAYPMERQGVTDEYRALNVSLTDGDYITFGCFEPYIFFSETTFNSFEDDGTINIQISLNGPVGHDVTVDYQDLLTGTATNGGDDYNTVASNTATITSGNLTTSFPVTIIDDPDSEDDETINFELSNAVSATLGADSSLTFFIHDNDRNRKVYFHTKNQAVSEGVGTYEIILKLDAAHTSNVDVDYQVTGTATGGAIDYMLADGTATILTGNIYDTLTVSINNDAIFEDDETIEVTLLNPVQANITDTNFVTTDTIKDNDSEPNVRFIVASSSGGEDVTPVKIPVALSAEAGNEATVDYTITGVTATKNIDFSGFDGTLTFEKGTDRDTIEITIINNPEVETDETFRITLSNPTNAILGVITQHVFTIEDDDTGGNEGPGGVGDNSNNEVWFRADDLLSTLVDNDPVTAWVDTSGNDYDLAQASVNNQPTFRTNVINGFPVVRFDGLQNANADYLEDNANITTATIIAVFYENLAGQGTNNLAQLWGSYDEYAHLGADGRNNSIQRGFSFDGWPAGSNNEGRYSLDGRDYGPFGDGANYYQWSWDTWHIAMAELDSTRTITRQVIGDLNGSHFSVGNHSFAGDLAEVVVYNRNLNKAQQIIINNYLGTKYGIDISTDGYNYYSYGATHKYDMAGIGRIDYNNSHEDAMSARMFRVYNSSNLTDNEFLMFAHNGGDISSWISTDLPPDDFGYKRITREWKLDEEGDVGAITIGLDTTNLPVKDVGFYDYVVWVDDDGDFTSGATKYTMTLNPANGFYEATNVAVADGNYVTFGERPVTINFEYDALSGMESFSPINLYVNLSHACNSDITVEFKADDVTATGSGTDYTLTAGTLTFLAGTTSDTISIEITGDTDEEPSEDFEVIIHTPTNAILGSLDTLTYTIIDDDGLGWSGPGGVGSFNNQIDAWLRSTDSVNLTDGASVADGANAWIDQVGNGVDAYQDVAANQPTYFSVTPTWNDRPIIYFDRGDDDYLKIADNQYMNRPSGAQTKRTIICAFRTSTETSERQVIFEEGGGVRGLNIYVEQDTLYIGGWNLNNDDPTTPWPYTSVKKKIAQNTPYFAILQFDFDGVIGEVRGSLNAEDLGVLAGAGKLFPHSGDIGLGAMNGGACFEGGDCDGGTDHYFDGFIAEFVSGNIVFNDAQLKIVHNYFGAKFGVTLVADDLYDYEVDHGYQVFGIGQEDVNNVHSISQGHGIVKIDNPSNINSGEYLLIGHNGGAISDWSSNDVPNDDDDILRVDREWRVDKQGGDIGSITVRFDTTDLATIPNGYSDYIIMIDSDGDFTSGATVKKLSHQVTDSADFFSLSNVNFSKGDYFTIGVINPSVEFVLEESSGYEAGIADTTYYIHVELNYNADADVTIDYETFDGSAVSTQDYTAIAPAQTLTISAGDILDSIPLTITNDVALENDETLTIKLSNPSVGLAIGHDTTHTFTILDDDMTRKVQFTLSDSANTEDVDTLRIDLHLSQNNPSDTVKVAFNVLGTSTAEGDSIDYKLIVSDTVRFAPNDTLEQLIFEVIDDIYDEIDETIIFELTGAYNANLGDTTQFIYTIIDNDGTPEVQFAYDSLMNFESVSPAMLEIILSAPSGNEITIDYEAVGGTATGGGSDYTLNTGTLTIPAGVDTVELRLNIFDDKTKESNEDVIIVIDNPTNATLGTIDTIVYTIIDNDDLGWDGPGGVGSFDEQIDCWLRTTDSEGLEGTDGTYIGGQSDNTRWKDQTGHGIDAFQNNVSARPSYWSLSPTWNQRPVIKIDNGGSQFMDIADNPYMNIPSGPQNKRTIVVAFRPAADISTRQVIYEEGGGVRGLNIYVEDDSIYIGGYNNADDDYPGSAWTYLYVSKKIEADKPYIAILEFNFDDFGVGGVSGHVNGEDLGRITGAGRLFRHPGDIGLGGQSNDACYAGHFCQGGDRNFFKGYLAELVSGNIVYNEAQMLLMKNYFAAKYGMTLPVGLDKYDYEVNHGYEVFGIGQVDADNTHYVAKGQGIIKVESPSNPGNGEFIMIGHDGSAIDDWKEWDEIDIPNNDIWMNRVERAWRVDKNGGDLGTINVSVDTTGLPLKTFGYNKYILMVDSDGDFTSGATAYEMVKDADQYYMASSVNFNKGDYFTIGIAKPSMEFDLAASEGFEPSTDSPMKAEITMNFIPRDDYTIEYYTEGITATNADYDSVGLTTFTYHAGQTTDTIEVVVKSDGIPENDETFKIVLDNQNYIDVELGNDTVHTYTIHDDDINRKVQFTLEDSSSNEGDYNIQVWLHLSTRDDINPTTVDYSITGGTALNGVDFNLAAGTVSFAAGDTIESITVDLEEDATDELDETFEITISNPNNCGLGDTIVYTYTIVDDDAGPEVQFVSTTASGSETYSPAFLQLELDSSGYEITVDYVAEEITATGGGIDYTLLGTGTLTIPAGEDSVNVEVDVFNDLVSENAEQFRVIISNPSNATIGANDTITYTILDDDNLGYKGPGGVGDGFQYFAWMDANRETSYANGANVTLFTDQSGNGNNATASSGHAPDFVSSSANYNNRNGINFNGSSEYFNIADNNDMNTSSGAQTLRTLIVAFRTGTSVAGRYVIFEEGGGTRGLNIYIDNGTLYVGGWNRAETQWGFTAATESVSANTTYYAVLEMNQPNGIFRGYLNGALMSGSIDNGVGLLYSHSGDIRLGNNEGCYFHDGSSSNDYDFNGDIMEFLTFSSVPNNAQKIIIENYFCAKYGITPNSDYFAHDGTYDHEVFGVGQEDASSSHVVAQGTGIVRIDNPIGLSNGEYLIAGHDNGDITTWDDSQTPFDSIYLVSRKWRVTETGDLTSLRFGVDTTNLPSKPLNYTNYILIVDSDPDGNNNMADGNGVTIYPLNTLSAEYRLVDDVEIGDNDYFTVGIARNRSVQTGDWHTPSTWLTRSVPDVDETAIISAGHTVTATADVEVGAIFLDVGSRVNCGHNNIKIMQGNITGNGTFNAAYYNCTVEFGAPNNQDINPGTYGQLLLSGSGTKTLLGDLFIYQHITILGSGVTMDAANIGNNIILRRNFYSSGNLVAGNSTFELISANYARISSNNMPLFYNLNINKSANDILMLPLDNISITNTLEINTGTIKLNSSNLYITNNSVGAIIGNNDQNNIITNSTGRLLRTIAAPNTYEFPVGDGTNYSPVSVTVNSLTSGGTPYISAKVTDAAHPDFSSYDGVHITRYWTVEPTNITSIDYDIQMSFVGADLVLNDSASTKMVPIKYNSGSGWEFGTENYVDGTNTLTWTGLSTFSDFTGGDEFVVLPIELIDFHAELVDNEVLVSWSTATELNNDYFTVEKSTDAVNYNLLTIIPGAGNSNQVLNYNILDEYPSEGISYYRLKQTDFDGRYEYFNPVAVDFNRTRSKEQKVKVYPNPVKESNLVVGLKGFADNEDVTIYINNMYGNTIFNRKFQTDKTGRLNYSIFIGDHIQKGVYMAVIQVGDDYYVKKIIFK